MEWKIKMKSFPFTDGSDNGNGGHVRPKQSGARDDVTRRVGSQKKKKSGEKFSDPPPPRVFLLGGKVARSSVVWM